MSFPKMERIKWGKERSWVGVWGAAGRAGLVRRCPDGTVMTLATWWYRRETSGGEKET